MEKIAITIILVVILVDVMVLVLVLISGQVVENAYIKYDVRFALYLAFILR